jgi:WD40 repeat protein
LAAVLRERGDYVWTISVSRSGRFAVSGHVNFSGWWSGGGGIAIWDLERRRQLARYETRLGISSATFSPDETSLFVAGRGDRAKLLRRDGGDVLRELNLCSGCWGFEGSFAPDGNRVVLCESTLETPSHDADPVTKVWDLKTGQPLRAFPRSAAAFTEDARLAISRGGALWNLLTGRDEGARRPPRDADWTVRALTGDGGLALLSSLSANSGPVGLWDPLGGAEVRRLVGHTAQVQAGAFTADGNRAVTGAGEKNYGWQDCTVRVWDTSSARELATLRGHKTGISAIGVSPDGRRIVSGDVEGRINLWEISG